MKQASGCEPIDELLEGGLDTDAITNFCGTAGTGKTNIAIIASINTIKNGKKVVFIDSEGGFSVERFKQIAGTDENLDKIIFFQPKSLEEQGRHIKKIEDLVKKEKIGLIVVDSAVALYRLECAEHETLEANKELGKQLSVLSMIARKEKIPVIITSHIYKKFDSEKTELIGGDVIKYWCKTIIQLDKTDRMSYRTAILLKHRSLPEGREVDFKITGRGIESIKKFRIF